MWQVLQPAPDDRTSPFPREVRARIGVGAGLVVTMVVVLLLMGRDVVCACGKTAFWQSGLDPKENSQQFADWYSGLHVVFGMGLFAFVKILRPGWTLGAVLLAVLLGHSIWEVAENSPLVIGLFSAAPNAAHYSGDSILNSLGDTAFAMAGAAAMPFLPVAVVVAIVIAVETSVTWAVGDGFIVGTLRLLGVDI